MGQHPGSYGSTIERTLPQVLGEYGFSADQLEQIEQLPQRVKNVNFRIRAAGRDWIMKCHTPAAAKNLGFSHRLELLLAGSGFPVAELQRSRSGETLVRHGETCFTLHSWVHGQQFSVDQRDREIAGHPNLVRELGRMVGALHLRGEPLVDRAPGRVEPDWLLGGPRRTVTSIRRGRPPQLFKALRLRLRPDKAEFDRWILARLPELYRQAGDLAATTLTGRDAADLVVAHNDLNWENLIFGPERQLLAVLDFDNAARLPRALDVGAAAAVLVGGLSTRVDEFMGAYAQASGREVDRELIELGMRWKCMRSMLWSIDAYLSGRVAEPTLVATWCRHLDDCLLATAQLG